MENPNLPLKDTDMATAVAYYGETELLDFIGFDRIEAYLLEARTDFGGAVGMTSLAKVHLHQDVESANVQLGDKYKIAIQADFANNEGKEVIIDVRMDRIFGVLLRHRNPNVA